MTCPLLEARELGCSRRDWFGGRPSHFHHVNLSLQSRETLGFTGPDGCGKGLLLNVLGLLEPPDTGQLHFQGVLTHGLDNSELARMRNQAVGFIFETPNLLPSFTVLENVAMPLFRIRNASLEVAQERAREILEFCGLWKVCGKLAERISPREAAGVAVARAFIHNPQLVVAINPRFPELVFPLLAEAAKAFQLALVCAGSGAELKPWVSRLFHMQEGAVVR